MPRTLLDALHDLVRLVVPLSCAGCALADVVLCPVCAGRLREPVRRVEHAAPRLDRMTATPAWPVWAVTGYTGTIRDLVVAWKDRGRTDLDRHLAAAMGRLACAVAPEVLAGAPAAGELWLVPAPSSASARRQRGREPVVGLARAAAAALGRAAVDAEPDRPVSVRVVRVLEHRQRLRAGALDQVGLGARARGGNLAGAVRVRRGSPSLRGATCVLVDDVLTTGATLAECERVLVAAGGTLVAGLVLAATPGPTSYPPGAPHVNMG